MQYLRWGAGVCIFLKNKRWFVWRSVFENSSLKEWDLGALGSSSNCLLCPSPLSELWIRRLRSKSCTATFWLEILDESLKFYHCFLIWTVEAVCIFLLHFQHIWEQKIIVHYKELRKYKIVAFFFPVCQDHCLGSLVLWVAGPTAGETHPSAFQTGLWSCSRMTRCLKS